MSEEELAEFEELIDYRFSPDEGEYDKFLGWAWCSAYSNPAEMDLFYLFFSAGTTELLQSDKDYLDNLGYGPTLYEVPVRKCTVTMMDEVLKKYFGISFEECQGIGLDRLIYNPEAECYYYHQGGYPHGTINLTGGERLEDGTVLLYHNGSLFSEAENATMTITLIPTEAGYRVYSHVLNEE